MTHPLVGLLVRWTHGPNVLVGPATQYDEDDDELFIVPDGLIHGHYWVPASECVAVEDLRTQGGLLGVEDLRGLSLGRDSVEMYIPLDPNMKPRVKAAWEDAATGSADE